MNEHEWSLSRKMFIKTLVISGVALQLPWLQACSSEDKIGNTEPLTLEQYKTVRAVQDILFPSDGNGPSARDINAAPYLVWVMNDTLLDPDEQNYIIKRIDQFSASCREKYNDHFFKLYQSDQEDLIELIASEAWGEKWLSRLLTLIFEALLLDPSYGCNTNEVGWEWLNHNPGLPRPAKELLYPTLFDKL